MKDHAMADNNRPDPELLRLCFISGQMPESAWIEHVRRGDVEDEMTEDLMTSQRHPMTTPDKDFEAAVERYGRARAASTQAECHGAVHNYAALGAKETTARQALLAQHEALQAERDEWKRTANSQNTLTDSIARMREAEDRAHNARLAVKEERAIADEARAEVGRLREALYSIDAVGVDFGHFEAAARTMQEIARDAIKKIEAAA